MYQVINIVLFLQLNTDVQFVLPIYMHIKQHLVHSTFPVYCYRFSFDGKLAYMKQLLGMTQYPGNVIYVLQPMKPTLMHVCFVLRGLKVLTDNDKL
jgi:hypothetical protein